MPRHPVNSTLTVGVVALWLLAGCGGTGAVLDSGGEAGGSAASAPPGSPTPGFPLTIDNCGERLTFEAPPARAATMNQGATEVMLALGLEERMVGTAYLDDAVLPGLAAAYASVPVLAAEYPQQEVLLAAGPDFVYGSYASAFESAAGGPRDSLAARGIASYLSPSDCLPDDEPLGFAVVFAEIREIAAVFGVPERGEEIVARLEERLAAVTSAAGPAGDEGGAPEADITAFWFDSGSDAPFTAACCGAPALILRTLGLANVFAELEGSWADGSWERVVAADPDLVVLVDASWDTAASKRAVLARPPFDALAAVRGERFAEVPFGSTTPGLRNVDAVEAIAAALGQTER